MERIANIVCFALAMIAVSLCSAQVFFGAAGVA